MKPGLDASMEYFSSGATESEEDPLQAGDKVVVINSPKEFKDVTSESLAVVDCKPRSREGERDRGRWGGRGVAVRGGSRKRCDDCPGVLCPTGGGIRQPP